MFGTITVPQRDADTGALTPAGAQYLLNRTNPLYTKEIHVDILLDL